MALTSQQQATLKAAILADPTLNAYPNTTDGNFDMCAQKLNVVASPAFTVWKSNVGLKETGRSYNGAEWAGMTSGNHTRLTDVALWVADGYDASRPDIRDMFNDIWSGAGGATTRANLLAMWKRSALLGEKILAASGTGSDASPATIGYEGSLSYVDVMAARSS
jgi:hypothetical protein